MGQPVAKCGQDFQVPGSYTSERHDWGEFTEHEERGMLVVTHGRRAGRIYNVEQTWRDRTCNECGQVETVGPTEGSLTKTMEWPGGLR